MITFSTLTSHNNQQSKTGSSPRCPIWFHYLVNSKNNSYFVGIGPICDIELTCIFWLVFLFVRCIKYRSQYYKIIFNTHLFSDVVIMTLNYFCDLFWCKIWKNAHFLVIYLFYLHQHTDTRNINIQPHSLYIASTQKTLKDGALSGVG